MYKREYIPFKSGLRIQIHPDPYHFVGFGSMKLLMILLLLLGNQPSINGGRPVHKQANAQAGLARVSGPSSCPLFSDSHMVCIIEIQL